MQNNLHKNQSGISLIEILVVLLLMSLMMTFAIPRFMSSQKGRTKKLFFNEFATLVSETMRQAVVTKKIHQIFWDIDHKKIIVKVYDEKTNEPSKHKKFKTLPDKTFASTMNIPESFLIENFFIQGGDEAAPGKTMHDVWTYIMPDGTSQNVIINIQDSQETGNNRFSIIINPFFSQVKLHDSFQKP